MKFDSLILGGNVFGWTTDEATSFTLLDHCVANGIRWIDTADHYCTWVPGGQGGESESIIGRWLARPAAADLSIITKVGYEMGDGSRGLSRTHILRSIDRSLDRLGRRSVDVYMAHVEDPDTPIEETVETFAEVMAAGKAKAIAVSELAVATIARGLDFAARNGLPGFSLYETLYNLHDREPFESEKAALARDHGMEVLPYRTLAAGYLTGKYRSAADVAGRARGPRAATYMNARGRRILDALDRVSTDTGLTQGQIAVAWVASRPLVAAPIVSVTSTAQLDAMLVGARTTLDSAQLSLLDMASQGRD